MKEETKATILIAAFLIFAHVMFVASVLSWLGIFQYSLPAGEPDWLKSMAFTVPVADVFLILAYFYGLPEEETKKAAKEMPCF